MANTGIKFLTWTYFNLEVDEKCDCIIKKCIDKAYIDATNQGAFNTIATNIARIPDAEVDMVNAIINEPIIDYDNWHESICNRLINDYSHIKNKQTGELAFTYGNAQKWVNMAVKYLYIFRSLMADLRDKYSKDFCAFYDSKFKKHHSAYHVPIDSFIMEAIWNPIGKHAWLPEPKYLRSGNLGKYASSKHKPWSKFDGTDYENVQRHIKSDLVLSGKEPIEWENENWIRIAKKRK